MPTCQQQELSSAVCCEECTRDTAAERISRPILFAVFKPLAGFRTKIAHQRRQQGVRRVGSGTLGDNPFCLSTTTTLDFSNRSRLLNYLVKGSHCVNNLTQIAGRTADPWITPMVVGVRHASKVPVSGE